MDAINLTGRLNLTVNTAKVEAQLAALGKQAPIKITATLPTSQLRAYREELTRVRKASKEVEDGFTDFAEKAALAGKRFAAFTVATTGFFALASAIKSGISNASDFEVELLKVQQVTRESARNILGLKESIFGVAKGLGVSSKELLSVGLTLGQAGRSIQEIKNSLAPLAKTRLAATFGDITDTVNALIAAQEQFKVTSKDTEQVLGSINVLSAKYAVEAQDLTIAIQKAGGAFSSFADSAAEPKKNLNELLALFTAVRSTTRESADTIATGFRTIFARLRNPKNISALEAFGINLKDDKGLLLKPLEQIRAISRAVKDLDKRDIRFSQIIEEVGGIRQQSKVIPLLEQMEKAEQALVTATQGANSLTRDAQIAQESLANQLAKTREEFLKLINDGFNSTEFREFAKITLGIASALIKVGEAIGPLIPAFATLAATKFLLPDAAGQLSGYQKVSTAVKNQFGPHKKFASGGPVGGSGSGDKVPAMLEPGEFVVPKHAAYKVGHDFLEKVRKGEKPKGYALGGVVGKITERPAQSAIGGLLLGSLFENFSQADEAAGRLGKALTSGATQFLLLNSILGTFGRTAKQTRILEEESQAYTENQKLRQQRIDTRSSAKAVKSDLSNVASSRDIINSGIGYQQGKLSDITTELEKNRITPKRREDLVKVRALQRVNEKLSNNPDDQTEVKNYLAKRIKNEDLNKATNTRLIKKNEDELKTLSNPDAIQKKKDRIAELKAARSGAISRKQYFEEKLKEVKVNTANPAGVKSQVASNQKEIDKILKADPDILQSATIIASLQSQKRDVQDKIRKLKKSRKQSTDNFIKLEAQYKELVKTEEELKQQLATPAQKKQFKESFDLQNNKSVTGSLFGIKFKRRTKADLERDAKFEGYIATGSAVAAGIGGLASSFGQDTLKNTPDSLSGRGLAAAGNAATLGAEFAAVGTAIHPLVGGFAGLGGAIIGFTKSLIDSGSNIRDIAIDKSLVEFSKIVELTNDKDKKALISNNIGKASLLVKSVQSNVLSNNSRESRDKAESLAGNIQVLLRGFAQNIGESTGSIQQFNSESKTLIEFASRFGNTPIKDLNEQFNKLIKETSQLTKITKEQSDISQREQIRALASVSLLNTFEDTSASIGEFETILNGGMSDLSGVFKRIGNISDSKLLRRANAQASSILGSVPGGKEFLKENQLINDIGRELPTLLIQSFKKGSNPLEGSGDQIGDFADSLSERFKLPESSSVKDSIVGQLRELTKNKSPDEIYDLIQNNLKSGLLDPILANLTKVGDVSAQSIQLRNQESKLLESTFSKISELVSRKDELSLSNLDIEEKRQSNKTTRGLGLEKLLGFDAQKLSILSGQNDNSIGNLSKTLEESRTKIEQLDKDKQTADSELLKSINESRQSEVDKIEKTTKALKFLADASTRVAHIEEQISREKSLREGKLGILRQYAFGSPDQKREIAQNAQAAKQLLDGGIGVVPPNLRQGAFQFAEQFKDSYYGDKTIGDRLDEEAIRSIGGDKGIGFTKGKSEKDLELARDVKLQQAKEANSALQKDISYQTKNLADSINKQFPEFISAINELVVNARKGDLKIQLAQQTSKLESAQLQKEKAERLSGLVSGTKFSDVSKVDLTQLGDLAPKISRLKDIDNQLRSIQNIKNSGVQLTNKKVEKGEDVYGLVKNRTSSILSEKGSISLAEKLSNLVGDKKEISGDFLNKFFNSHLLDSLNSSKSTLSREKSKIGSELIKELDDSEIKVLYRNIGNINIVLDELSQVSKGKSLSDLNRQFNELSGSVSKLRGDLSGFEFVGPIKRATGGGVPGLGNFDSVPAMLTPGEFVIRKSAAEALGPEVLNQLNGYSRGGRVKFGSGGSVTKRIQDITEEFAPIHEMANEAFGRQMDRELKFVEKYSGPRNQKAEPVPVVTIQSQGPKKEEWTASQRKQYHLQGIYRDPTLSDDTFGKYKSGSIAPNSSRPTFIDKTESGKVALAGHGGSSQKQYEPGFVGPKPFDKKASENFERDRLIAENLRTGRESTTIERNDRLRSERGVTGSLGALPSKNIKSKNSINSPYSQRMSRIDKRLGELKDAKPYRKSNTSLAYKNNLDRRADASMFERGSREMMVQEALKEKASSKTNFKKKGSTLSENSRQRLGYEYGRFPNSQFGYSQNTPISQTYFGFRNGKPYSEDEWKKQRNPIKRAGGGGTGPSTISGASRGITCELNTESLEKFNKAISEFSKPADKLAIALEKFPTEFTMQGEHNVHVMVTGADALASLEDTFGKLVEAKIKKAINDTTDRLFNGSVGRMV